MIPEINSIVRPWNNPINEARAKVCLAIPVEYSAAVANMGVAIVYDILNTRYAGAVCERVYYPEPKLKRAMARDGVPLFSKETSTPLKEFDLVAFSSYYPVQMLAFPDMPSKTPVLERRPINPPTLLRQTNRLAAEKPNPYSLA